MSAWDLYEKRIAVHGKNKKDAEFIRECRMIDTKLKDSFSYFNVKVYPCEFGYNVGSGLAERFSFYQDVAIINSDNLNEKFILSRPTQDIEAGALIYWMDNYWLVCEKDANVTLYTRAKLLQCNHLLKWINADKTIMEQWCIIEDGTKYLTGEYEDRDFVVTRGDSRISMQIARNKYTTAFGRQSRFLIDDPDSPHKLSYLLTKPLKKGLLFNGKGTFKFVLQEVTATEYDNHELGIANYYKFFPRQDTQNDVEKPPVQDSASQQGAWI